MPSARRPSTLWLLPFAALALFACSVQDKVLSDGRSTCIEACPSMDPDAAASSHPVTLDGSTEAGAQSVLCGADMVCNPDLSTAVASCVGMDASAPDAADGGDAALDAGLDAGGGGDAHSAAHPGPPGFDAGGDGGALACHVVRSGAGAFATCVVSGTGADGEACQRSTDCAPGYACVEGTDRSGNSAVGQCRLYCCGGGDSCVGGTFCSNRRLFEDQSAREPLHIPVCAPADNCALLSPDGGCAAGSACTIVSPMTTSCVQPGAGKDGAPCPCDDGYLCAQATDTCRKLCHLAQQPDECGGAGCVSGSTAYPTGIGVCASPTGASPDGVDGG